MQESFLSAEVRDDYLVTEKYKLIWSIEIKILQEIMALCEKHGLSHFVYGGTLLGTIRHGGFIPWDDDMDVAMLRSDYEKFLYYAEQELDIEVFTLQKSDVLGEIFEGFARIRYNDSTAIIKRDREKDCNHGIYVDIFPLDQIPDDPKLLKKQSKRLKILEGLLYYHAYPDEYGSHMAVKKAVALIKGRKIWEMLLGMLKKEYNRYNTVSCKRVGILSCAPYDEKCYWYVSDIQDTMEMPFEYLQVKVPVGYDRCLKIGYGDYMEFPPVEERGKWHDHVFFDPCRPYTEYLGKEYMTKGSQ